MMMVFQDHLYRGTSLHTSLSFPALSEFLLLNENIVGLCCSVVWHVQNSELIGFLLICLFKFSSYLYVGRG